MFETVTLLMGGGVVSTTAQGQVPKCGRSSVEVVDDMMDVAPAWRPVTSGPDTVAVSQHHRPPEMCRLSPHRAAQVQDFGSGHYYPAEGGVTGMAAGGLCWDDLTGFMFTNPKVAVL
jgi:hypothetical protein